MRNMFTLVMVVLALVFSLSSPSYCNNRYNELATYKTNKGNYVMFLKQEKKAMIYHKDLKYNSLKLVVQHGYCLEPIALSSNCILFQDSDGKLYFEYLEEQCSDKSCVDCQFLDPFVEAQSQCGKFEELIALD